MIKLIDPKAIIKLVSQYDGALLMETDDELKALREKGEPSRLEQYLENSDLSVLKFKDGETPSIFHVRCLLSSEVADINQRYMMVDTESKRIDYKNRSQMYLEIASKCLVGMEDASGKAVPVTIDELGFVVSADLGSTIWVLTTLRKNLKKD